MLKITGNEVRTFRLWTAKPIKGVILLLSALTLCVAASAQKTPEWQLFGGYQYLRIDTGFVQTQLNIFHSTQPSVPVITLSNHENVNGWIVGAQENVNSWFGGVVDVSGSYATQTITLPSVSGSTSRPAVRTTVRMYTLLGGPQFTLRRSSVFQPFARGLIGGAFPNTSVNELINKVPIFQNVTSSSEGLALGGGAGTDVLFSHRAGVRVAVDVIRTYVYDLSPAHVRVSAALIFKLGSK
jgi:hypothetical protein